MSSELPYWVAALYGVLTALAILLGGGLVGPFRGKGLHAACSLAAIGAGFLFALGLLGALPEALEMSEAPVLPVVLALGSLTAILFLHGFGHRGDSHSHSHEADAEAHAHTGHGQAAPHARGHELSLYDAHLAVAGLALHSLLDGVAVSASLQSREELGMLVALFVLLHKLPEGATAAALTLASGGLARDLRRNVLIVAFASLTGALAVFVVGPYLVHALAITAGVTTGVALGIASHLLRNQQKRGQAIWGIACGIALFAVSNVFVHHHH